MPYVHPVEHDTPADVAELVDALVSGTSGGNIVGVQVSPSAYKSTALFAQGFSITRPFFNEPWLRVVSLGAY